MQETYNSGEFDYSDDSDGFCGSGEPGESGDYDRFVDFCEVTDDSVDFGDYDENCDYGKYLNCGEYCGYREYIDIC